MMYNVCGVGVAIVGVVLYTHIGMAAKAEEKNILEKCGC